MKKQFILSILIVMMIGLFSSCSKVPAGNVGVKVYLLGQKKGVDSEVLGVGRYHIGINEELFLFPTFQQNYVWTRDRAEGSKTDESFTFQTSEGMSVNADIGIAYHIEKEKVNEIFQKYRKGVDELTDIVLRNAVRDAFNNIASKYNVESVYGKGKADLIMKVHEMVKEEFTKKGIIVDKLFYIGSIRLPNTVINALNMKVEATQRAQQRENELREAEAEAKKKIAQAEGEAKSSVAIAKGKAQANKLLINSINKTLIDYERLQIEKEALKKWNGSLPTTMLPNSSLPFINLK
jgi:regulator of protease activity HflC (stomatin/prohibitin superfamily)